MGSASVSSKHMCEHTCARTTLCHLFVCFFEVDVSLNRGHQSWGLVFFHAYRATKPHPGVLVPWNSAGWLKVARVTAFAARKQQDLSRAEGPNTSSRSVTFILLENHCASGTSEHPTSPLFFPADSCRFRTTGCCWKWKRGILRTVMHWTHQTTLVWHGSLSFPQSQVGPSFLCKELAVPLHLCLLWVWEMLRTVFNSCNWTSTTCVLQGRSSNLLECIIGFNWPWFFLCPQTSLYPEWRTWGYILYCLSGCAV